jgi:hypothetical protein
MPMPTQTSPRTVDEYIAGFAPIVRATVAKASRRLPASVRTGRLYAEQGEDFRLKRIDRQVAEMALAKESLLGNDLNPLQRLIDNQVLEQRQEGGGFLIAFSLDRVAENLAAFAHVNRCKSNTEAWKELIEKVMTQREQARGFLAALKITHQFYADKYGWT